MYGRDFWRNIQLEVLDYTKILRRKRADIQQYQAEGREFESRRSKIFS